MSFHEFGAAINRQDWSFENRAPRDEKRYKEKIRDAVKDGLEDLVSDGSVITADPNNKKLVRVPTKSLELPDFRYGEPKEKNRLWRRGRAAATWRSSTGGSE
jgi:uncharacterized sporulation protein YeaH/YhbH (DUF444 family)